MVIILVFHLVSACLTLERCLVSLILITLISFPSLIFHAPIFIFFLFLLFPFFIVLLFLFVVFPPLVFSESILAPSTADPLTIKICDSVMLNQFLRSKYTNFSLFVSPCLLFYFYHQILNVGNITDLAANIPQLKQETSHLRCTLVFQF